MKDTHLEDFLQFLRFPSISTDPARSVDMQRCAEWLVKKFHSISVDAQIHPTAGHPIVLARSRWNPGRPTVLIYGHYDVQPVDPLSEWRHPPFEPHIQNGIITARGATDNKGQILAHIFGVEEKISSPEGLFPNVIFLIEGEEEIGSPNLAAFLEKNKETLKADFVMVSDTGMIAPHHPTLTYGLRGIAAMELRVSGPARDLHSGIYGGAVANPLTVLSRLLATLHQVNGRVAVHGFYDAVRPMESWERLEWASLPMDDEVLQQITGVPALGGEEGFDGLSRIWARPTAEINGLWGGYQGAGSKTVIPREAHAKLTFRLVPDQSPSEILDKVATHLQKHCPESVRLEIERGHSGLPYLLNPHEGYGAMAQRALKKAFSGAEPALIREGGSIPIVNDFKRILGLDTLLLGLALPDCGAHSPNETFHLENLDYGIKLNNAILKEISST